MEVMRSVVIQPIAGKNGTKRSLHVDGQGGPLGVAIGGANVHDSKLLEATLEADVTRLPAHDPRKREHLCLDKGYDNPTGHQVAANFGYIAHIRPIGENAEVVRGHNKRKRPRRWVVERTIAWLNRCRALLVRYAKKCANYLGLVLIACCLLWFRRLNRLAPF
jgi:putative transposase